MSEIEGAPEIVLDGRGGGKPLKWEDVACNGPPTASRECTSTGGTALAHQILVETLGIEPVIANALVEEDTPTRPAAAWGKRTGRRPIAGYPCSASRASSRACAGAR